MTAAEHLTFMSTRDIRYNAVYYFTNLWNDKEPLTDEQRPRPGSQYDVEEYLLAIIASDRVESVGEGDDRLYTSVLEKRENRVLCAMVLAYMQEKLGWDVSLDLDAYFFDMLAAEIGLSAEQRDAALRSREPRVPDGEVVVFEIVRAPDDDFVMDKCIESLKLLGYEVLESEEFLEILFAGGESVGAGS